MVCTQTRANSMARIPQSKLWIMDLEGNPRESNGDEPEPDEDLQTTMCAMGKR